jgi:hypothetical protein
MARAGQHPQHALVPEVLVKDSEWRWCGRASKSIN